MKKSTVILIAIIYVASIVVISVLGLKGRIYNEIYPVTAIECLNQSDRNTEVIDDYQGTGLKLIKVPFTEEGTIESGVPEGTMVQFVYRVLPDNATNKRVKFEYNETLTRIKFVKDEKGNDLGIALFSGTGIFYINIVATDGTQVYTTVVVQVY